MPPEPTAEERRVTKRFDVANAARAFEIELFWKRSVFFWGFVAAAFIGYATLRGKDDSLAIVLACLGWLCSVVWTLANRGSKFWFENWESKVQADEEHVTGPLFSDYGPPEHRGCWLSARRFSVSRLAIALSDFMVLTWTGLLAVQLVTLFRGRALGKCAQQWTGAAFVALTVVYAIATLKSARSGPYSKR